MNTSRWVVATLLAVGTAATRADEPDNAILAQLLGQGVPIRDGVSMPLPAPAMPDGLDAAAQRAVLESIADPRRPIERLLRESIVAPFVLDIETRRDAPDGPPVRSVDVYFVAYGNIEAAYTREFVERMAAMAESEAEGEFPSEGLLLDDEALSQRGLIDATGRSADEHWMHGKFALFDRVYISATRHAISHHTGESIVLASILDPRFVDDADYPNAWRTIERHTGGTSTLGPAHPYVGAGFYVKLTRLHEPDGAIFVEYHHVFDEPHAWFDGKNLLRSKLPLVVQDRVRKFRRRLAKASGR